MIIHTIGYEGKSIEEFVDLLVENDVQILVDVRELPLSRKAGFSKRGLAAALEEWGVGYIHMRELGTPRAMRQQLRDDGDYAAFFAEYAAHLEAQSAAFDTLMNTARDKSLCLMCFEQDPEQCHRSVLADKLAESGFSVGHL